MLAVLQKLGPPGAQSVQSRGPGNNPPAGLVTTVHCLHEPAFGAGGVASRGSEFYCVSAGQRGFVSAFLYSHFLKQLAFDYLHRKQKTGKMGGTSKENQF